MAPDPTNPPREIAPIRPLLPAEREAASRACAAHADCVTALYGGVVVDAGGGAQVLFNPHVADPDWNLGTFSLDDAHPVIVGDDGAVRTGALQAIRRELGSRDRLLTVLLDSRRPEWLGRFPVDAWSEVFRFSGLIYPASRSAPRAEFPRDVNVQEYEAGDAPSDEIADVFEAAFGTTVTGGLDPGYRAGIAAGLERAARNTTGPRLRATVLRIDGQPAAIGFRVQIGAVVGLYNLGVAPPFRGRRLGGAITEHRVERARAEGAEVVFLLTENPRVEASQLERGFVPGFELVGLTESSPGL